MKKEILIVTGSLRRGGAERVISILSNELVTKGWKIHICTMLFSAIGYELNPKIDVIDLSCENRNQIMVISIFFVEQRLWGTTSL